MASWMDKWRQQQRATSNAGYNPVTSAGRSTVRSLNTSPAEAYWGRPYAGETGTTAEFQGFRDYVFANSQPGGGVPTGPSYGGGGGGGWGGGGGGGGGPALTQAMLDAMLGALGTMGPALQLQTVDLPTFAGQNIPAFSPAPYRQATRQLGQARAADIAASRAAGERATQALRANYANAYANAPTIAAPAAPQVGVGLQGTVGGGGDQAAVAAQTDAAAASDQASFQNLLGVLAAADQTAQNSRLNQVAIDQNAALNAINAQQRGLLGGINMAQLQAREQWRQQDAERRYQNALMQQQWQREELMRNQDITNQQRQGTWQQRNEMIANRMGPLLELLMAGGGAGLNTNALTQLLQGWAA